MLLRLGPSGRERKRKTHRSSDRTKTQTRNSWWGGCGEGERQSDLVCMLNVSVGNRRSRRRKTAPTVGRSDGKAMPLIYQIHDKLRLVASKEERVRDLPKELPLLYAAKCSRYWGSF